MIDHYRVGVIPHHIAPAWDMSELYVDNEGSSSLTVLDIKTGRPKGTISIPFPYNLYFTPDGTKAIDVVERLNRIEFRDWRHGWALLGAVGIPWPGADHMDFSADGSYFMISTEYSGILAKVDVLNMRLAGYVKVGGLPIDVKVSPDGSVFYVTNQGRMGVSVVDPVAMKEIQFIPTGRGAHGLQVRAGSGLRHGDGGDGLAGDHLRQPLKLLLFRPVVGDVVGDDVGLQRDAGR